MAQKAGNGKPQGITRESTNEELSRGGAVEQAEQCRYEAEVGRTAVCSAVWRVCVARAGKAANQQVEWCSAGAVEGEAGGRKGGDAGSNQRYGEAE